MAVVKDGKLLRVDVKEMVGPRHPFVGFIGMTAVGKTKQAEMFAKRYGCALFTEREAERTNPYLAASYDALRTGDQEPQLGSQLHFLHFKARNYMRAAQMSFSRPAVVEPVIEMDRLYAETRLSGDTLAIYLEQFELLYSQIPKPDVIVYLRAKLPAVMVRMRERAMASSGEERRVKLAEIEASFNYWKALNARLEDWVQAEAGRLPIVAVDTTGSSVLNTPFEIMIKLSQHFDRNGNGLIVPEGLRMRT